MSWSVVTHLHRERSTDWYWGLGALAVAGAGFAIFIGNFLFAVIIIIAAASIGMLAARGPREHAIRIDDRGISIDGTRYTYSAVHSFWVEHDAQFPALFITLRGIIAPHVSLLLDSAEQGEAVRAHLLNHVREEEQGPHLGESLAALVGL